MWCAFMPGFENLQESAAGFGATQDEAEADLRRLTAALAAAPASPEPITTEVVKDRLTTEALDKPASETEA
ncbi:hypothetical protein CA235_07305 [Sphingomonas sp. ABOLF]|nr:hypothetical protein CA235_07305 [Sphingomonas sp. ABOLF]